MMRNLLRRFLDWLFPLRYEARCEADELMEVYGDGAYYEARRRSREAFAAGDYKLAKLYALAQNEIAHRSDQPYGADTATRYFEGSPPPHRPPDTTLH